MDDFELPEFLKAAIAPRPQTDFPQLMAQLQMLQTPPQPQTPPLTQVPSAAPPVMPRLMMPQVPAGAPQRVSGGSAGAGPTYSGNAQGRALIEDAARKAGFTGDALRTMVAIGIRESGGNPRALNNNAGTGDLSYGLFQINMLGGMGPARRAQFGLASNDALLDPYTNARVAYQMSGGGRNFTPWSTYKNRSYLSAL